MKSLRKSRTRLQISTPIPLPSPTKSPSPSLPPHKVIRAISSPSLANPNHLPFQKGDFFYVTSDPDSDAPCYEAHNPVTGARGLVPKNMFEEFLKGTSVSVFSSSSSCPSPPHPVPKQHPRLHRPPQQHPRLHRPLQQPLLASRPSLAPRPSQDLKNSRLLCRRPPRFLCRARRRARCKSR